MRLLLITLIWLSSTGIGFADVVYVVDGDSLKLSDGTNVRMANIDAPEYYQTCKREDKSTYNCGIKAREKLESLVKLGNFQCNKVAKDIYNRDMCECFVGKLNVNLEMVKSGWAVVYKSDKDEYSKAQTEAKKAKLGIWQGKFMKPELYRILFK